MGRPYNAAIDCCGNAAKWNAQLVRLVTRWKRLRIALAMLFVGIGVATLFLGSASVWSTPFFIAAFIAYLLYLDSRDQLREIRARHWTTITPRASRVAERKHEAAAKTTSSAQ